MEWLFAWLIVNALFLVWRILVTTEVETRDRQPEYERSQTRTAFATPAFHESLELNNASPTTPRINMTAPVTISGESTNENT